MYCRFVMSFESRRGRCHQHSTSPLQSKWAWPSETTEAVWLTWLAATGSERVSNLTKMAGWSRIAAGLRSLLRSPRSLRATQVRRAVVPSLFGGSVATGIFLYYQHRPSGRTLPFTVYAEEHKVSRRFLSRVVTAGSNHPKVLHQNDHKVHEERLRSCWQEKGVNTEAKFLSGANAPQLSARTFTSCLFQETAAPLLSARKVRFNQFASVEFEQEPYMTPRDFLYSVMLEKVDRKNHLALLWVRVC